MIRVTVWYEYIQESGKLPKEFEPQDIPRENMAGFRQSIENGAAKIREVYPRGVMGTLAEHLAACEDMEIVNVNMYMPDYGLPDEVLNNTDVLIWWSHLGNDAIPDSLANKVKERVLKGMGFIVLHSAHSSKPLRELLGTSGILRWREEDFCRMWNVMPTHPISQGIPEYVELEEEEMYGEPFDIPKPDDVVFASWFRGGEVFRSGCTWTRGYGKIFYFQPGHETNPSYHNPYVKRIIENVVRWAAPTVWRKELSCIYAGDSPESLREEKRK